MPEPDSDRLTRFLLPRAGVRGVHVRLDATWRQVSERNQHGVAVGELLGEACAASALLTGHVKVQGRLSLQLRSGGPLRTLFTECTAAGTLRGIARVAGEAASASLSRDLRQLGNDTVLAVTIENPGIGDREPVRYQGLVPIESDSLAGALEGYFERSEQLPTCLLLAADGEVAAGLMLQKLPGDEGDADGWNRASTLFATATPAELLQLPADELLRRLFHEEGLDMLGSHPLAFDCSCSRGRVAAMLESLGPEEARASVVAGKAEVICEFCGNVYELSQADVDALFTGPAANIEAPDRVQ